MFGRSHLTPTKKNSVCTPPPQIDFAGETASAAPKFKNIKEQQAQDYNIEWGFYSEPGAPDYNERIESCTKFLRENENLKSIKFKLLKILMGKQ